MPLSLRYRVALEKLFGRKPVALLEELRAALGTASRTTIFRILSTVGYRTSFSHAGRYYTLRDIPKFDPQGLWFYHRIGFSVHGTLRATLVELIEHSPAGQTHEELFSRLGLRVHDTLRSLVGGGQIVRQRYQAAYLYLSGAPERASMQWAKRREMTASSPAPASSTVVDILVQVLHHPKEGAGAIAARVPGTTPEQVEAVLRSHGLQKKTAQSRWKPWLS